MMVLGDFNTHINDENDNEAGIFVDTVIALGFNQYVSFPMHRAGNILDLVFTETCNSIEVKSCRPGPIHYQHRQLHCSGQRRAKPLQADKRINVH